MPMYEYGCGECGEQVVLRRRLSDDSAPVCPLCGAQQLARRFSRVSVVKSEGDRIGDVSWIDRDLAQRIRSKASDKLNPSFSDTLDRMESSR